MVTQPVRRTFRDPAGSLFFEGDNVFRTVSPLDRPRNALAVAGPQQKRFENKKIERSLQKSNPIVSGFFGRHPT